MKTFDAIIVGSGAGGGTAAYNLTKRGFNVLVLEKGDWSKAEDFLPYDELRFLEHKTLTPDQNNDFNTYVKADGENEVISKQRRWWIGNMVGGSTMLWEANLPRYTEEDFSVSKFIPQWVKDDSNVSMVDWPWKYEEFHKYFEEAEHLWGVSGRANQSPAQEPTRNGYDYPMPPLRPHGHVEYVQQIFRKHKMYPYLSPRGINSRTFDGRPGCPFCGYCQGFGCAVNDRASSANTVLKKAIDTGRCEVKTGCNVTRLIHQNGKIEGVEYCSNGSDAPEIIKADLVIVSIQAIQSARLFLHSEIPNDNQLIGKYLTYHTKGSAEFVFPNQPRWGSMSPTSLFQPRTSLGSLQLRDLYVINDNERKDLSKGGKFSVYDPYTINPPIKALTRTSNGSNKKLWGRDLVDRMMELRNHGGISFSFTGETISDINNRVELDPDFTDEYGVPVARTYYKHHEYDKQISAYCLGKMRDILEEEGAEVRVFKPQGDSNPGYGHNHGTLRAGKDPNNSVLDENCQSHSVKGLYVLDSAWMPTAGASNPTLTQIANALRVTEIIKK